MIQVTVESTTKAATPQPGFRSGQQWYSIDNPDGSPGPYTSLPNRESVVQIEPYQGADGKQHYRLDQCVIVQAAPPKPSYQGKPSGSFGKKSGYDSLGNQVGNAVTNATNLVCNGIVQVPEGSVISTIAKLAHQIMGVGDAVRAKSEGAGAASQPQTAPQYQAPAVQPQPQVQPPNGGSGYAGCADFDDDIPF